MFRSLVDNFERTISKYGFCSARLYVEGVATQVTASYSGSGNMEIVGLPSELPAYLLLTDGGGVYLDPEKSLMVEDAAERSFYLLYRTWDPRVIANAKAEEEPELSGRRWKARCKLEKVVPPSRDIGDRIGKYASKYLEIEFVTDGNQLLEMSEWDFGRRPTRLTLVFEYPHG